MKRICHPPVLPLPAERTQVEERSQRNRRIIDGDLIAIGAWEAPRIKSVAEKMFLMIREHQGFGQRIVEWIDAAAAEVILRWLKRSACN
ncbi:MAG: hypothetical protein V4632_00400 [Pseudomonadota bacterium]